MILDLMWKVTIVAAGLTAFIAVLTIAALFMAFKIDHKESRPK